MKKFQLRITFEQKEYWHVSANRVGEENPSLTGSVESAALLPVEKTKNHSPVVYRRSGFFKSFSERLKRFAEFFRLAERKEKSIEIKK